MTPFKIPKSAYEAIQQLIHLSENDFKALLEALNEAEPSLDTDEFWTHVAPHVKQIEPTVVRSILREIFQMHDARTGEEQEEFADAMAEAASEAKSDAFPFEEADRNLLKDRLVSVLEGRGLQITLKAAGVMLDQDHVFFHARVLTDVRPVFDEEAESVSAAVILHTLRIHYGENTQHKDFYVALDPGDIQGLREALDRAEKKAKRLEALLKTSGVPYLNLEE